MPETVKLKSENEIISKIPVKSVSDSWLGSYDAYNRTLTKPDFYKKFSDYEYILIYQSDCWIFRDDIDKFIDLGFDYYGAPWPHYRDLVGNGGFSLRKVSKMIEVCEKYSDENPTEHEDTWFCLTHKDDINACSLNVGCNFAFEIIVPKYFNEVETIPMGLHGNALMRFWGADGEKLREYIISNKNCHA